MTRYLIVKHFLYGTFHKPIIEKSDLVGLLQRDCDHIFDTIDGTEFDPKNNTWVPIKEKGAT